MKEDKVVMTSQKASTQFDLNRLFRLEGQARLRRSNPQILISDSNENEILSCLTLQEERFTEVAPRAVFVGDSHPVPHFKEPDAYLELNRAMQKVLPTLFMAQTVGALDRGALPGESTLFSPLIPSLHRKAIANSKLVVSFHLEPLLTALANRIPAIFLSGRKTEESDLASRIGVPVILSQSPAKIVAEIEMYFVHYSWKKIDDFCQPLKDSWGVSVVETLSSKINIEKSSSSNVFTCCSISDANYWPFFLGFLENVRWASGGEFKIYLLALDSQVGQWVRKLKLESKIQVLYLKDLWNENEIARVQTRSVGFRAFSTKPRLIARALKETQAPVFYCDSDVYFCQPSRELEKVLDTSQDSIVLFPHLNDEFTPAQRDGLFNAGMIGVGPGAENFLEWWSEICYRECSFDDDRGLRGDQGYLSLVPVLFNRVKIFKGRNHNVARWNSKTLQLRWDSEVPEQAVIDLTTPVATYHAAFCDDQGVYQLKFIWDQVISFFSPAYKRFSSKALEANCLYQQRNAWTHLDHSLKWDQLQENWIIKKLFLPLKVERQFWFSKKGRRCLIAGLKVNRIFRSLGRLLNRSLKKGSAATKEDLSSFWVESNLKALKSPLEDPSKASKAA